MSLYAANAILQKSQCYKMKLFVYALVMCL